MDHDLIVVGGGAAGLGAVRAALWAGANVALVTDSAPGGECTFTGCVPSKTLLAAARDGLGFAEAMARVRATVEHVAATESAEVLRAEGATVIEGRARLVTHDTVAVGDRRITAPRIVLATGSRPSLPKVRGLAEARPLTNETVFALTEAPKSLGVIGGGATGCELAQAFGILGTEVTLFEFHHQLLPAEEPEAAIVVRESLQRLGVSVRRRAAVVRIGAGSAAGGGFDGPYSVFCRGRAEPAVVERLLVAAGRTPATEGLGLEEMKLELGEWVGHILTDERLETSVRGVYAAGDVAAWRLRHPSRQRSRPTPLFKIDKIDEIDDRLPSRPGRRPGIRWPRERVVFTTQGASRPRAPVSGTTGEPTSKGDVYTVAPAPLPDSVSGSTGRPGGRSLLARILRLQDEASPYPSTGPRAAPAVYRGRRAGARGRHRIARHRAVLTRARRVPRWDPRRQRQHYAALMLSHAADEMGRIAAGNALGKGLRGKFRGDLVPRVVFTDPEVASVGVIPGHAPPGSRVAYLPLAEVDRAITDGRTDGFIAIVAGPRRLLRNAGGGRILGATIVAPRAGEMIQEVVLAMRTKAFAGRLAQASHAYPTWSGGVQKAAAQFFGEIEGRRARRVE